MYDDYLSKLNVPDKHRAILYYDAFINCINYIFTTNSDIINNKIDIISILQSLIYELDSLVAPIVAYEIARARQRGMLKGRSPSNRYRSFFLEKDGSLAKALVNSLRGYKSTVNTIIDTVLCNTARNLQEAHTRLQQDRPMLARSPFNIHPRDQLIRIEPLGGDKHNSGRTPLLMVFRSGIKIVYKPSIVNPGAAIRAVLKEIEAQAKFKIYIPYHLHKNGYSWAQFIEKRNAKSLNAIHNFYFRAGVLAAILDFMLFVDGNEENILASGEYPVLVDIETFFHPIGSTVTPKNRTALDTGLFGSKSGGRLELPGIGRAVSAGAFSIPTVHRASLLTPVVAEERTDNIHIRFIGAPAPDAASVPYLSGRPQYPHHFVNHILRGYWAGSGAVSDMSQGTIRRMIASISRKGCTARVVLRPTTFYEGLLKTLQQPHYLQLNEQGRPAVIRRRLLKHNISNYSDFILAQELSELARFDVPYFFMNCHETTICSASGKCEDGYYDEPPIHGLLPSWRRFTPAYRMAAMSEIKQAVLSTAAHDHGQHR